MKRRHLLLGLMLVFSLGVITTPAYAASDCKEIDFGAEELCIEIDKDGDDYELDTEVTGAGSSYALKCDILLPNNELHNVGACDGEFEYDDDDKGKVKIYARLDGEYKVLEATYDFDDGEWIDDDDDDDDNNDEEGFDVDVDDDEPDEGERIDLEIEAIDDDGDRRTNYDEDIRIIVEMYDNGEWDEVDDDDEFDFHGIDETEEFDEDDDGLLEFSNAISFNEEKKFRICVEEEDDDDVRGCVTIEVGDVEDDDEGDADDIDEVEVDVDDTSIKTNERIDLIIELLDDDGDRVEDITEEITITVEDDDGDEVDEGDEYDLIGIDNEEDWDDLDTDGNGYVKLNNVIEFNEEGEFTIIVEINGEKGEIDIEVDDNNSNSDSDDIDDIKVDVDDDTPKTNQEIDLIIELLDDDNDRVEDIDAEIKITVEDEDGDEVDEGDEYDLIGIDDGDDRDDWDTDGNGYYRGRDVIEFNDEGEFTIIIEIDGEKDEVTVDVDDDNTSDNDDIDNFRITANPSRPDEDEDIDITIIARDNDNDTIESYEGEVEFIVQKRVSGFRRTAGSADYDIDDDEYEFDEDDDGEKKFNNFLEFKDEGEFRLKVVDTDVLHAYGYVYFDIGDDDSDVDGFSEEELETVEAIYKIWPSLIDELKDDYSDLEDNDEREDLSDDLYDDMEEIIDDENNRTIDDYDEFIDRFSERYSFTISERD